MREILLSENFSHNKTRMRKTILALAITSAFIFLLAACGSSTTPSPTASPSATTAPTASTTASASPNNAGQSGPICGAGDLPAFISDIVLAKDTQGANFEPVDVTETYEPNQATFHAVVTLKDAPKNLQLGSVWYLMQASGYKPQKIEGNNLEVAAGGSRNVDFTLKGTQAAWPVGSYCLEIYANGKLAASKPFSVVAGSSTSSAGIRVVQDIVLAEGSKPDTFEPVNPTNTFKKDAGAIHATVKIQDAPANTVISAKWYPPDQEPLEFNLPPVDGTRWLDFRLTPTPNGFPGGEYKVEIFVNEKLVDTKTFTVQ